MHAYIQTYIIFYTDITSQHNTITTSAHENGALSGSTGPKKDYEWYFDFEHLIKAIKYRFYIQNKDKHTCEKRHIKHIQTHT